MREETLPPPDLRIVCGDSISLTCHQSVIAGSSSFLRELLLGVSLRNGDDSIRPGDDVTLFVPEAGGIFGSGMDNFNFVLIRPFSKNPFTAKYST